MPRLSFESPRRLLRFVTTLATTTLVTTTACASEGGDACDIRDNGYHTYPIGLPAWSDDGTEIAALTGAYTLACYDDSWLTDYASSHYSDATTSLFTIDPTTFVRTQLGPPLEGFPRNVFDMRRSGYLLVSTFKSPDDAILTLRRVSRDGTSAVIATPDGAEVRSAIPAPDGKTIAVLLRTSHSETSVLLSQVLFIDTATLTPLGPPIVVATQFSVATWTPTGEFIVDARNGAGVGSTFRVELDGTLVEVPPPGCFEPPTTSSAVRSDGTRVVATGGELSLVRTEKLPPIFGCQ
jgi:hypothetical protein